VSRCLEAGQPDSPVSDLGNHGQRNQAFQEQRPPHLPLHVVIGAAGELKQPASGHFGVRWD